MGAFGLIFLFLLLLKYGAVTESFVWKAGRVFTGDITLACRGVELIMAGALHWLCQPDVGHFCFIAQLFHRL